MRAFIAVEIPNEIIERLSKVQEELPPGLKLVKPQNMHITLKFLGEIDERTVQRVSQAMDSIGFSPFQLTFSNLGVFPSRKFIRVIWVGTHSPELESIHGRLRPKLSELGFKDKGQGRNR
ncbi:MAG: RNA 2',3'-cyclic phosphodiesterase [Candidatus Micrarchaeota archaeon]